MRRENKGKIFIEGIKGEPIHRYIGEALSRWIEWRCRLMVQCSGVWRRNVNLHSRAYIPFGMI